MRNKMYFLNKLIFLKKFFAGILVILSFNVNIANAQQNNEIITTIKPLYSLVQSVLGDTQKAQVLISSNSSPHDFQFKPSQIKLLQNAKIVFFIDENLIPQLQKVLKTLAKKIKKVAVVKAKNIKILQTRENPIFENNHKNEHEHENEHEDEHEQEHEHENEHKNEHEQEHEHKHEHGDKDLHIWLSPDNAIQIIKHIAKNLSLVYPENSKTYQNNSKKAIQKIKKLKTKIEKQLKPVAKTPFMVFHDAYQYFDNSFKLNIIGSIIFESEIPLSIKRVIKIQKAIKKYKVKCIFSEPEFSDKIIKTVTKNTQVKTKILDPLGSNLKLNQNLYFNLMNDMANKILSCLQ